jgi:uncharacterized membrane protein YkoI
VTLGIIIQVLGYLMINRLLSIFLILFLYFSHNSMVWSQNKVSLEQAVKQVKEQNNGRIISATTKRDNKQRSVHNIRLLTPHGQLKRYQINERTGQNIQTQKR